MSVIENIVAEIADERLNQLEKWGQQDHESLYSENQRRQFETQANTWKQINDARVEGNVLTWDGILLEEVYEALAEVDPLLRRAELVQVAAVAAAEIEAIDRALASDESPYADFGAEDAGDIADSADVDGPLFDDADDLEF